MSDQTPKSVFLFYGEDNFGSNQKLRFWKAEFEKKYGEGTNVETIEGKKLKPSEFLTNIGSLPFLSEKKLVVVTDFFSKGKKG